jgi:hypothetical protein
MIVRKTGSLLRLQQHRRAHVLEHSGDEYKVSLPVDNYQRTNEYALYNCLSTFSGTHYVTPGAIAAQNGFRFLGDLSCREERCGRTALVSLVVVTDVGELRAWVVVRR